MVGAEDDCRHVERATQTGRLLRIVWEEVGRMAVCINTAYVSRHYENIKIPETVQRVWMNHGTVLGVPN